MQWEQRIDKASENTLVTKQGEVPLGLLKYMHTVLRVLDGTHWCQ